MACRSSCSIASASQEPIPGRLTVVCPTVIASQATTKNQPPDIDIIIFHTRPGMAKGNSRRTKRRHGEKPNCWLTSCKSCGTVRNDWKKLKVMFQAWLVKMAKIAAHSTPSWLPGNSPIKNVTVKVRNPSTGTDCRISSAGIITCSALRLLAASVAITRVNSNETPNATNMRNVVRRAYPGSKRVSSVTGLTSSTDRGRLICSIP